MMSHRKDPLPKLFRKRTTPLTLAGRPVRNALKFVSVLPRAGNKQDGTRPIRLAHFTTVDQSLWFLLRTELELQRDAGFEVVAISAPGPFVANIETLGIRHVPVGRLTCKWSIWSDFRAATTLWRILRDLKLDILHTHTPKAGVIGRIIGRLAGVPVVVNTCHGLAATDQDDWSKRVAVCAVEALAAQFSDAELFQNSEDLRTMALYQRKNRCKVVGNGIDLQRFAFDSLERARVRSELGIGPNELLVGGVGRRVAEKGILDFAASARQLCNEATFIWIGPTDPLKSDALLQDLQGITFLGPRDDMVAIYSALDVFVLPSYREGLPRSAMEAAACGRSMVLTDIRGNREIGSANHVALFVPPHNPAELTGAIRLLLANASLRERLGAEATVRSTRAFDQRDVASASIETYYAVGRRKGLRWATTCTGASLPHRDCRINGVTGPVG